jgi:hypothetical protein
MKGKDRKQRGQIPGQVLDNTSNSGESSCLSASPWVRGRFSMHHRDGVGCSTPARWRDPLGVMELTHQECVNTPKEQYC